MNGGTGRDKVKATTLDPKSSFPSRDPSVQSDVLEQDLFVPLSENLIIGFFFDMIHDFPESSVMTNDSKTDIEYLIMVFDSVFSGYWPECGYTLHQIIRYFNEQHGHTMSGGEKRKRERSERPTATSDPASHPVRGSRKAAAKAAAAIAESTDKEATKTQSSQKGYLSASGVIERAHGFFYELITRQGANNGVLTFDYDTRTMSGKPVSAKNKSVITDVTKIAGGGGGLPSNYFFGGFLDHEVRVQSFLEANVTTANVFKSYSDARDGANIQSFTEAAIKAINLGSPPDYTDALGSWEQYAPAGAKERRGGAMSDSESGSDTSSLAYASNVTLASKGEDDPTSMVRLTDSDNSLSKPMFVVEDALKSATQLPATFALNNRFVFSVGEGNKFNLVPIKSTAERYDAAAKKLQTPPELYDKGIKAREEVLERIATKQASCYDYFYRKFNLRFGSVGPAGVGIPIATQDQRAEWKDFITVSIGPNKLYFKDTANLVSKMATGSNIIGAMGDNDVLDYNGRKDWATSFVRYLVGGTESAAGIFNNREVMDASVMEGQPGTKEEIASIQNDLVSALKAKDSQHVETVKAELPLDYLYNFSFYVAKTDASTDFIPSGDDVLFPSYFAQTQRIHNIRGQRQTLAVQMKGTVNDWLLGRLNVYQVSKVALMAEFQKVVGELFGRKAGARDVNTKTLLFPSGATEPSWSKFVTFLLLRQEKASKPIDNKSAQNYVKLLWKDVVPESGTDARSNQLGMSIRMVLTIVFNLRLAELCMRRITIESIRVRETSRNDNAGLNDSVWVPTMDLYLTDIVMQGCSNDSMLVVSPSGVKDTETVEVRVSGDSEQDVKSGASVASVLNKWRTRLIDQVFRKGSKDDTKGVCVPLTGSKKEPAAEKACIDSNSSDYKAQLKCLSGTAGASRAAPMHDCLANWLQTVVGNAALQSDKKKRGAGFKPLDLRRSFGELFQKTVGDFFQVKVAQFLNDNAECFTCEGGKCSKDDSTGHFGRSTYRPYAENPTGPTSNGLLVASDAFYKMYKRPILASAVQLNTFDVMAGLIGLQQSANVVLQTIAKTTRSPGTALYGISNLSAPVRAYIESRLVNTDVEAYGQEATAMEADDDEGSKPGGVEAKADIGEGDDEEGGIEKEVNKDSLQLVEVDIDLISVLRRVPAVVTDVRAMIMFLHQNRLSGSTLTSILQKPYSQLASDEYETGNIQTWVFTLRVMFDYLCYYRHMRPEEALARSKVIVYMLALIQSRSTAPSQSSGSVVDSILSAFVRTVNAFKENPGETEPESSVVVLPIFPKEFIQAIEKMNNASKSGGDPFTVLAFTEIIDLMQKTSGDKKISSAVQDTNEATDRYEKYTSGWLKMFEKVNMQNREMDAAETLMMLSSLSDPTQESSVGALYEAEETSEMEADEGMDDDAMSAARSMLSFGDVTQGTSVGTDDGGNDAEMDAARSMLSMAPPVKRQRRMGGSRRHHRALPKHRTLRKHANNQKTLTQILRELKLGI